MSCLKRFLNQVPRGITKIELENIAIKWLKKLDKDIKNLNPIKDAKMEEEVWLMIQKTKKWDIPNMNTLKDNKEKEKWIV